MYMSKYISYFPHEVEEGFMVRCAANPKVTAFGETEELAVDNLVNSITEYLDMFPDKEEEVFNTPIREIKR